MPRFGRYAEWLELESDRFDHTSELPAEANAGNRFYGRDVAEFVRSGLSAHGMDARVYHNLDDDPRERRHVEPHGATRERRLVFPAERPVDAETMRALDEMCREAGSRYAASSAASSWRSLCGR